MIQGEYGYHEKGPMGTIKWQGEMSLVEREWFDKCPKAVLFHIAQQFAMLVADDQSADAALATMAKEWEALHANGIVPQKPAAVRTEDQIIAKWPAPARERYLSSKLA